MRTRRLVSTSAVAVLTTQLICLQLSAQAAAPSAVFSFVGPSAVAAGTTFTETTHVNVSGDSINAAEVDLSYASTSLAFLSHNNMGSPLDSELVSGGGGGRTIYVSSTPLGDQSSATGDVLLTNETFRAPCTPAKTTLSFLPSSGAASATTNTNLVTAYPSKRITIMAPQYALCASPSTSGQNSSARKITVFGTGFSSGTTVDFGPGITTTAVSIVSPTTLTAMINVSPTASTGDRDITASPPNAVGETCQACFTLTAAPQITSTDPSTVDRGTTTQVSGSGTGFSYGAKVAASGKAVTTAATVGVPYRIDLTITTTAKAKTGYRDLTVTNSDGGQSTCPHCLSVG